ncbi:MAG: V-type ATP synthase subunit F [Spirochaetaceae bacterium]|jgi:V/A-type H+-transporting ATPase subunit F|nr:V-type ATP synthase subunit F [Spirochaetaceae bacterium]
MEYYFVGDRELVTAFRFVGIDGAVARKPEDARRAFSRLTKGIDEDTGLPVRESCRVLILTEETADWLGDDLTDWQLSGKYPLIVEIPGIAGPIEGRKTLVDAIREAIGIHV